MNINTPKEEHTDFKLKFYIGTHKHILKNSIKDYTRSYDLKYI